MLRGWTREARMELGQKGGMVAGEGIGQLIGAV
jgi:hypothetical protein